jgi:hypothetical protein
MKKMPNHPKSKAKLVYLTSSDEDEPIETVPAEAEDNVANPEPIVWHDPWVSKKKGKTVTFAVPLIDITSDTEVSNVESLPEVTRRPSYETGGHLQTIPEEILLETTIELSDSSVRPKPLFWFRSGTETETQIGRYFRPIP